MRLALSKREEKEEFSTCLLRAQAPNLFLFSWIYTIMKEELEMTNSKYGEQLFAQRMKERGCEIEDLTDKEDYWKLDIDFRITNSTGTNTFEVKWDSKINSTHNFFVECSSTHNYGCLGWFDFCEADWLAYGDAITEQFHCIKMEDLRQLINSRRWWETKEADGGAVRGYIVPISEIQKLPSYKVI